MHACRLSAIQDAGKCREGWAPSRDENKTRFNSSDVVEESRGSVWSEGGGRGTTAHRRRHGRYLRCLEEEPFLVTAIASRVGTGTQSVEKTTGELFMSL